MVTVCYNCVELIEPTIQSVLEQDQNVVEFIVIDGGSTDGTIDVINKYRDKIANFKSERDFGIYDAMNKGIKAAKGDWLIFLNAGDVFYPEFKVEKLSFNWPTSAEFIAFPYLVEGHAALTMPVLKTKTSLPSSHQATLILSKIAKKTPFKLAYKVAADYEQYKHRKCLNENCVYIESHPITHVMAGGFSAENIGVLRTEYFNILFKYDGLISAFIWYARNRPSMFKLVKVLMPSRVFSFLREIFV